MDENQTAAASELDPFGRLLEREGAWEQVDGLRLRHVQTGEAFGRLPVPPGEDASAWEALVAALADLDSDRLVPPRAVIDDGAGLLYDAPDGIGISFARMLESEGSVDQRETMRMAADLAAAVTDLHDCGAVLGRLRLQDVVRGDDGGWVLLVSPASGARVADGPQRPRQEAADVVLLASAVVTVLTGRRPSAQRSRPPLRSTHPQLDPVAADALDRILDDDGRALSASDLEGVLRGGRDRLGDAALGEGPHGAVPSSPEEGTTETLPALGAGTGFGAGAGIGAGAAAASRPRPGLGGGPDPDDDGSCDIPEPRRRGAFSRAGGSWRPVEPDPRRTRWVLLGAAAMVLGAAALAGWQLVSGPEADDDPALAAGRTSSGVEDGAAPGGTATGGAGRSGGGEPSVDGGEPGAAEEPSGSGGAGAAVSAQHSPEYAAAALIGRRAEALRTGDRQLLESVYVPGAADLADDLATLDQADGTETFADLEMTLMGAAPVSSAGDRAVDADAGVGAGTAAEPGASATVTGTVEATGMAPAPGDDESALHQDLEILLEVGDGGGWQIVDVTPV